MQGRCNFNNIDVITDFGIIGTIFFGNISTMQINRNNDRFYFLQKNTNRHYNASITKNNTYLLKNNTNRFLMQMFICTKIFQEISFKIILSKKFLVFENTRLILS